MKQKPVGASVGGSPGRNKRGDMGVIEMIIIGLHIYEIFKE